MTAKKEVGWVVGLLWVVYVQLVHTSTYWRTASIGTRQGSYAFLMGRVGARWAQAVAAALGCTDGLLFFSWCALYQFR